MGKFSTSSGFSDLDGNCEITGVDIDSYHSSTLNADATGIKNHGGSDLHATVTFPGVKPYTIKAKKNASGDFKGDADDGKGKGDETWAATATTGEPAAAAKGY